MQLSNSQCQFVIDNFLIVWESDLWVFVILLKSLEKNYISFGFKEKKLPLVPSSGQGSRKFLGQITGSLPCSKYNPEAGVIGKDCLPNFESSMHIPYSKNFSFSDVAL